jgi:hypothetical protein
MEPSISVERFFSLVEKWRLCAEEVLITSRWRFIPTSMLVMELVHLCLH